MIPTLRHDEIPSWLSIILSTRLCPFILGDVGVGKSTAILEYCRKAKRHPIVLDLNTMYEMDLIGYAVPDQEKGKFAYLPCDIFPLEDTKLPQGTVGFTVVLEEFGNCGASMQTAAQRVMLDRMVGKYKLHPTTQIILVGNKTSSGTNSKALSAAVRTRCAIAELDTSTIKAADSAIDYMVSAGYHPSVVEWATQNKDVLRVPDEKLKEDGQSPFFTHRGLQAVSDILNKNKAFSDKKGIPEMARLGDKMVVFQSLMGYTNGSEFHAFLMNPATGLEEIFTSPTTAQIPTNAGQVLKAASFIAAKCKTSDDIRCTGIYLNRLPPELASSIRTKLKAQAPAIGNHSLIAGDYPEWDANHLPPTNAISPI